MARPPIREFDMKAFLVCISLSALLSACASQPATLTGDVPHTENAQAPIPGAEVINAATCSDPRWLLSHFPLARLASGSSPEADSGFPIACCASSALGREDRRCQLDWPSSDLVECTLWLELRDALTEAYPRTPRPRRVQQNIEALEDWHARQHQCAGEEVGGD